MERHHYKGGGGEDIGPDDWAVSGERKADPGRS